MYQISVMGDFEAAHALPNYNGPCARLHGHHWKVRVKWRYDGELDPSGISLDLRDLKKIVRELCAKLDHRDLTSEFKAPSAENIARWFYTRLQDSNNYFAPYLYSVTIIETEGCEVIYKANN